MAVPAGHRLREYGPWFVVVSDALWPAELHARISFRSCIGVHCWSLSSLLGRCYRERAGWIPILEASLTTDAELRHLDRCVWSWRPKPWRRVTSRRVGAGGRRRDRAGRGPQLVVSGATRPVIPRTEPSAAATW